MRWRTSGLDATLPVLAVVLRKTPQTAGMAASERHRGFQGAVILIRPVRPLPESRLMSPVTARHGPRRGRSSANGLWGSINTLPLMACRKTRERGASPSAGVTDSQSLKTTESDGPYSYEGGNTVKNSAAWTVLKILDFMTRRILKN